MDPETGPSTQPDPIGLAGGLNLYGYAGGDPINFSDPFGLCAEGADSVQVSVQVTCPNKTTETHSVWAHAVSSEEEAAIVAAASRLTGGSRRFRPADVAMAYQAQASGGGFYVIPVSVAGGTVAEGGVSSSQSGVLAVGFRRDVLDAITRGDLGQAVGNLGKNVANVVGHEGVHLLAEPSELIANRIRWGFRR